MYCVHLCIAVTIKHNHTAAKKNVAVGGGLLVPINSKLTDKLSINDVQKA